MGRLASAPTQPVSLDTKLSKSLDEIRTYPGRFTYTVITTAATTVVFSGSGTIKRLYVLGGTLGAITVYNNTAASGTDLPIPATTPAAAGLLVEDVYCAVGATIVTATAMNILVEWEQ